MKLPDRPWVVIPLFSLVLSASTGASLARAQQPKTKTATLLVDTDDVCHFFIDDEDKGQLSPDKSQKFTVGLGEHILKCKNDTISDLVWRKVVEVKDTSQVAAVVSLKSLHIQYDQAVAKAQNQKAEADAAAAKQLAEAQAEEKQREAAKAAAPLQVAEMLRGSWSMHVSDPSFGYEGDVNYVITPLENGAIEVVTLQTMKKFRMVATPVSSSPGQFVSEEGSVCWKVNTHDNWAIKKMGAMKKGAPIDAEGWTDCALPQKAWNAGPAQVTVINNNFLKIVYPSGQTDELTRR